jgi:hypothetical protein
MDRGNIMGKYGGLPLLVEVLVAGVIVYGVCGLPACAMERKVKY